MITETEPEPSEEKTEPDIKTSANPWIIPIIIIASAFVLTSAAIIIIIVIKKKKDNNQ